MASRDPEAGRFSRHGLALKTDEGMAYSSDRRRTGEDAPPGHWRMRRRASADAAAPAWRPPSIEGLIPFDRDAYNSILSGGIRLGFRVRFMRL